MEGEPAQQEGRVHAATECLYRNASDQSTESGIQQTHAVPQVRRFQDGCQSSSSWLGKSIKKQQQQGAPVISMIVSKFFLRNLLSSPNFRRKGGQQGVGGFERVVREAPGAAPREWQRHRVSRPACVASLLPHHARTDIVSQFSEKHQTKGQQIDSVRLRRRTGFLKHLTSRLALARHMVGRLRGGSTSAGLVAAETFAGAMPAAAAAAAAATSKRGGQDMHRTQGPREQAPGPSHGKAHT